MTDHTLSTTGTGDAASAAAPGATTDGARPALPVPAGFSTLTPFLCVSDGAAAIDFYVAVFGATEVSRMALPGGGIAHAELQFGNGRLQLGDAMPDYDLVAPPAGGSPATHSIAVYVPDVDAAVREAEARGAHVREQPTDFVTGDRFASIVDPYGHRWSVMTRIEDVSAEEAERRLADWAAQSLT